MQDSSVTPSSHRLAATPTLEYSSSSASSSHGGRQGGGEPPPLPKFNLPDSYRSRTHTSSNVELHFEQTSILDVIARRHLQSGEGQDNLLKVLENHQESIDNDPRTRVADVPFRPDFRPFQLSALVLAPSVLADLVVLDDSGSAEPTPLSSTSFTSTAAPTATQQAAATGGCCIPPGCNIV